MRVLLPFLAITLLLSITVVPSFSLSLPNQHEHPRSTFIATATGISSVALMHGAPSFAFAAEDTTARRRSSETSVVRAAAAASSSSSNDAPIEGSSSKVKIIVYHPLSIQVDGITVPVAAWHPLSQLDIDNSDGTNNSNAQTTRSISSSGSYGAFYQHRIAVSKIGKLLAGWNLPKFIDRSFELPPNLSIESNNVQVISSSSINNDSNDHHHQQLPQSAPVILLAHGYLGSRFDLSHLAETLASQGFLVLSPEYPESLAASYDATQSTISGLSIDRTIITNALLSTLTSKDEGWNVHPKCYGIVGHSLGCGTVDKTGDASWTRVCLAGGYPSVRGPKCLFIGSVNDGAVPVGRAWSSLVEYKFERLEEERVRFKSWDKLPERAALIFANEENAPNHISFLAEGTNDAMVEFLSPLLPLARALGIPVLDFDKYQLSRDSKGTGEVVIPLVVEYLKQMMNVV